MSFAIQLSNELKVDQYNTEKIQEEKEKLQGEKSGTKNNFPRISNEDHRNNSKGFNSNNISLVISKSLDGIEDFY